MDFVPGIELNLWSLKLVFGDFVDLVPDRLALLRLSRSYRRRIYGRFSHILATLWTLFL